MVICKFFQHQACRFGSKCQNDHIDLKQVVKTDVEAASTGKQWPFSCYGPFKDKSCIPNFIRDQSFEEVRFLCYESKKGNFFDQFHQQFTKEAMEANMKMKSLLQFTPEILDVLVQIYDAPSLGGGSNTAANKPNPFGSVAGSSNMIFGKSTASVNPSAGSIFGGTTNNPAASYASAGSIFGGGSSMQQNSGGGIFGGSLNNAAKPFAAATMQPQQTSFFSQQQQGQAAVGGSNLFGGPQQSSVFGGGAPNTGFGSGANVFGQPAVSTTMATAGGGGSGIFSQSGMGQQAPSNVQTGIFAQAQQTQNVNPFLQQQQQQQQPPSIFAQAASQIQHNAMMPPSAGNAFAQPVQQQQFASQNPSGFQTQNSYAQMQPPNPMSQPQQPQQQQPPPAAPASKAGEGNFDSSIYSRIEDLKPEELEAFKADFFPPGCLPSRVPPPRELC